MPSSQLTVSKLPHVRQLDGIRAAAISLVFIGHANLLPKFPGGFGVTVFFFLSGYLITTLLRIERSVSEEISLKNFYIRRILRINPPLWISMAALALLVAVGALDVELDSAQVAAQALFFTNYMPGHGKDGGLPIPLWSLAVEEHFYLIFPYAYFLLSKRCKDARIAFICAIACVAVLLIRYYTIIELGYVQEIYYWTHTRIDSILFGCILALWQNPLVERDAWMPKLIHVGLALAVILVTFAMQSDLMREGVRYTLQGMALFVLFSYALQARGPVALILNNPVLQKIGLYSYTIYLVHYAFMKLAQSYMPGQPYLAMSLVAAVASWAFAAAMHKLVEKPLGMMRRRLNPVEAVDERSDKAAAPTKTQPA